MKKFPTYRIFNTQLELHDLYRRKEFLHSLVNAYPMLFDKNDIETSNNKATYGNHFYEWLAAILLYHSEGWLSLVEGYQFSNYHRKQDILSELITPEIIEYMGKHPEHGGTQCPDLLVYTPDLSN